MTSLRLGRRVIGPGRPVYVVAELSANHHQRYEEAVALIRAAAAAGADAVKLQTYTPATLTLDCDRPEFHLGGTIWEGRTLYDLYGEAYTPWEWHAGLKGVADELGLDFFSTPFDPTAVAMLEELEVPAYKIASFELVDLPLIAGAARTGKPLMLSTGMATLEEIDEAVAAARAAGAGGIALLHCNSGYPAAPTEMHLRTVPYLAARYGVVVGLSDHTLGHEAAVAAVALGACIIEKHLIRSRADGGPDAAFSLEPAEFAELVRAVRTVEAALGGVRTGPTPREEASRRLRRSLFVVQDVAAGERFTAENIRSIRPGHGLPPKYLPAILGARATRDLPRGTPLQWEHVDGVATADPPVARPFLQGVRVALRPLTLADATPTYVNWLNDPAVTRYLEVGKFPATLESVCAYLATFENNPTALAFAIIERASGQHIGNVTLNHIDPVHRTADTGLLIGEKSFWGQGLAYEAWGLLLAYAFDRLNLHKVVAGAIAENRASIRTLEKLGFRPEGRFRAEKWVEGRYVDTVRLGLLREEFQRPAFLTAPAALPVALS
ncbi:MAG: pseudaminic acid synthase [Chloroflexi bacterium]|nr:pseudaminic acid synthase [Chloroflexota bacterium]